MKLGILFPEHADCFNAKELQQKFPNIALMLLPYNSILTIPDIIAGKQQQLDILLFTGITALKHTESKIAKTIPWEAIPHTSASWLQALLFITRLGKSITCISTDLPDKDLVYTTFEDAKIPFIKKDILFTPAYSIGPSFINETAQLHQQWYQTHKTTACITMFYEVYQKLLANNVPVAFFLPTRSEIYNAIRNTQINFLLDISRESQLVVIDILIHEPKSYAPFTLDEYQLQLENINVAKHIYIFAQSIQAAVTPITSNEYVLFTTRRIVERQTDKFSSFPLLSTLQEKTNYTASIGIGFGHTAQEAKSHARTGKNKAVESGGNRYYLVYDLENIRGPFGITAKEPQTVKTTNKLATIAEQIGINAYTLARLHSIMVEQNKNEFTSAELADLLKISVRSANRLLTKLLYSKYCFETGKKYSTANKGRPSRIMHIQL